MPGKRNPKPQSKPNAFIGPLSRRSTTRKSRQQRINFQREQKGMQVAKSNVAPLLRSARDESAKAGAIAECVVLPHKRAVRLPVNHEFLKTALTSFYSRGSMEIIQQTTGGFGAWALFRSPIAPLWSYRLITSTVGSPLETVIYNPVAGDTTTDWSISNFFAMAESNLVPSLPFNGSSSNDIYGVYIPDGHQIQFALTSFGGGITSVQIVYDIVLNDQIRATFKTGAITMSAGSGTAVINAPGVGFLYFQSLNVLAGAGTILPAASTITMSVYQVTATSFGMFPAFQTVDLANSRLVYNQARVNASSLLLTDTANRLNLGGNLYGARAPVKSVTPGVVGILNPFIFNTLQTLCKLDNVANSWAGEAAKGAYTWTLPDSSSLAYSNYSALATTAGIDVAYDLADFWNVNMLLFEASSPPTPLSAGQVAQSFQMKLDYVVEFQTASQLMRIAPTEYSTVEYEAALRSIARVAPFTENPTHFGKVLALVMRAMRELYPVARPYIKRAITDFADGL